MIFPSAPITPPESERKNEQTKTNYYNLRGKNLRSRKKIFTFLKKIADFDKIAPKKDYTCKVMPMIFQWVGGVVRQTAKMGILFGQNQ